MLTKVLMLTTAEEARATLTAAWLNSIAAGVFVTGGVAPLVAALYGVQGPAQAGPAALALYTLAWLFVSASLHLIARAVLGKLAE